VVKNRKQNKYKSDTISFYLALAKNSSQRPFNNNINNNVMPKMENKFEAHFELQ